MKILHIAMVTLFTEGHSYQDNIITKYHAKNHEVHVFTNSFEIDEKGTTIKASLKDYINQDNVHIHRLKAIIDRKYRTGGKFKWYPRFLKEIEIVNPDILFIHGLQFLNIQSVTKYLKRTGKTTYIDQHGDYSNSASNWISKNILHRMFWKSKASKIEPYIKYFYGVMPSRVHFLLENYQLPKEKVKLLLMGVDDDLVELAKEKNEMSRILEDYGINEDKTIIISGGKIGHDKIETLHLVEAMIDLPDFHLILFGPIDPSLKPLFDPFISNVNITYIPWLDLLQSYRLFLKSDIAVFLGRHSVYWEQAAGMSVPLIVKRWPGTEHVNINGNCLFLNSQSKDDVIELINDVFIKHKYESMKEKAIEASSSFSYKLISKRAINE